MGFQQGISGLNAASKNLDVIGHNIANSGTTGFKSARAEFADLVATSMGVGSSNSAGVGVEVEAIAQQFTQGNLTLTGNGMDVAINGGGFFKLQMPDGSPAYTRAGNFKLDKSGDVVTNGGAHVMGYKVDPSNGVASSSTVPLSFPVGLPIAAKQTTEIKAALNLDARAVGSAPPGTYGTSVTVHDSLGAPIPVHMDFVKTAANKWDVNVKDNGGATVGTGSLTFDTSGAMTSAPPITFTVPTASGGAAPSVTLNLANVTQFGSKFAVSDMQQDGYAAGQLNNINISQDGSVVASYSNGVTRTEAQVALTGFRNPQGLVAVGGNNWVVSADSGAPVDGKPGSGNLGSLRSGALEESNVDLTAELVNMMTAQRAYQANAQTIKTQDQVMSTMVNLR